jgi:GH15 family glucan-1,4-alpha-glucosidase
MKLDKTWLPEEDSLLLSQYKRYGDAERLRPLLQYRSTGAIIKHANKIGIKTRRADSMLYTWEELKDNTELDRNGCWNWLGDKRSKGYGVVIHGGQRMAAHRLIFTMHFPEIDITKKLICHHCDNSACINPWHMYCGTYTDNNRDTVRRGRYKNQYGGLDRACS